MHPRVLKEREDLASGPKGRIDSESLYATAEAIAYRLCDFLSNLYRHRPVVRFFSNLYGPTSIWALAIWLKPYP
jgi:hypothetical protein